MTTYGTNTEALIASLVPTIYENALFVARENNLATRLVTVYNDKQGLAARSNTKYGEATLNTVGELDDLTSQIFTPSVDQTLTPAEAGANFFITDSRVETDPNPVIADASTELGMATAAKIDIDVFANFSSLTGGTIGTSGSVFSWAYLWAMGTALKKKFAPKPWYWVGTAAQYHRLAVAAMPGATVTNDPAMQARFGSDFYQGTYGGINLFVSENCPTSSTDAYCALFSRGAIALDMRRPPRLELERKATARGTNIVMSTIYADGVWHPEYGIQGIFTNVAPTGTS